MINRNTPTISYIFVYILFLKFDENMSIRFFVTFPTNILIGRQTDRPTYTPTAVITKLSPLAELIIEHNDHTIIILMLYQDVILKYQTMS